MSLHATFTSLRRVLVLVALLSTTYLYLYPIFHGCAFSSTTGSPRDGFRQAVALHRGRVHSNDSSIAPFRLLVLADPQLEGDSSLPDPEDALLARLGVHWTNLRQSSLVDLKHEVVQAVQELVLEDVPRSLWALRKTLDLFGNDYYLAHIYRTLHWWSIPTHVTVLGDLIGSQWVSDDEFDWRGWRYWHRVLAGAEGVDHEFQIMHEQENDQQRAIPLESADDDWSKKIINIVGNHDIGYAGDVSDQRIARFERVFGRVNWDIHLSYPAHRVPQNYSASNQHPPSIHLIVLNSMILDTPAKHEHIQGQTYEYINGLITSRLDPVESRNTTFTLLLTHIPLHKPEGICVDAPFFDFWDHDDDDGIFKKGGLKEQNHLSEHVSQSGVLQGLYGMSGNQDALLGGVGRRGLILTGHDHEGCDVVHYIARKVEDVNPVIVERRYQVPGSDPSQPSDEDQEQKRLSGDVGETTTWSWQAARTSEFARKEQPAEVPEIVTFLREVTLRSMMGDYSGNAGLLSLWYDFDIGKWEFEIQMCPLGTQHIWWAVHIVDIAALLLLLSSLILSLRQKKPLQNPAMTNKRPVKEPVERSVASTHDEQTKAKHQTSRESSQKERLKQSEARQGPGPRKKR